MREINSRDLKIAIIHYYLISVRGGERAFHTLAQTFPTADLYAVVHDPASQPEWLVKRGVRTSFVNKIPGSKRYFRQFFMFYPFGVEEFDFSNYDLVISSSAGFTHGALTGPSTCHICYCYNTFRYAWNWYHEFMAPKGRLSRALLTPLLSWVRTWDVAAAQRVDYFSAISQVTHDRIKKYYRRESEIIYPPVNTSRFSFSTEQDDYYLIVSELVPYKKTDIAVQAFNKLGKKLIVVGDGPDAGKLRAMAGPNISFLGRVPDAQLQELNSRCRAFIFMPYEDFGMTPIEANAAGRPVLAYGAGGALETVVDGKTGIFFPEQTVDALIEAVNRFEHTQFDPYALQAHARTFDTVVFQEKIRAFVRAKLDEHRANYALPRINWQA